MIDTLIVVKDNNYGLTRDAELLAQALSEIGVTSEIAGISSRGLMSRIARRQVARRIIHLERVFPQWFTAAAEHVLIPNQERFPQRHLGRLRHVNLVLAKTLEGCATFAGHAARVEHLGFTSEDRFEPAQKDWSRVLHLAGGSTLKGTEDVLALWDRHPEWPELVLVQKKQNAPARVAANVRLVTGYIEDAELRRLQNSCGIHLCPSRAEGWGHNIVEGLSCGALVITTDGAPMNEHVGPEFGLLVQTERAEPRHLGTSYFVSRDALEQAIRTAVSLPWSRKMGMGALARDRFLAIDRSFRSRLAELFGSGKV
jgi:hypothetical protein